MANALQDYVFPENQAHYQEDAQIAAAIAASLEEMKLDSKEESKEHEQEERKYILECMGQNRIDPLEELDTKSIPAEESSSPERSDQKNNTSKKDQKIEQFLKKDVIIASKFNVEKIDQQNPAGDKEDNLIEL